MKISTSKSETVVLRRKRTECGPQVQIYRLLNQEFYILAHLCLHHNKPEQCQDTGSTFLTSLQLRTSWLRKIDFLLNLLKLGCEPQWCIWKIMTWRCQKNHIICKKGKDETLKFKKLSFSFCNPVQRHQKQVLMEWNPSWEQDWSELLLIWRPVHFPELRWKLCFELPFQHSCFKYCDEDWEVILLFEHTP